MRRSIYLVVLRRGRCLAAGPRKRRGEAGRQCQPTRKRKSEGRQASRSAEAREAAARWSSISSGFTSGSSPCPSRRQTTADLQAGPAGQDLLPRRRTLVAGAGQNAAGFVLKRFDLGKRKSRDGAVRRQRLSSDRPRQEGPGLLAAGELVDRRYRRPARVARQEKLNIDAIEVRIDPRAEWRQMFDEAWRINRDYFYDPGMHGADWPAIQQEVCRLPAPPGHARTICTA